MKPRRYNDSSFVDHFVVVKSLAVIEFLAIAGSLVVDNKPVV